MKLTKCLIAASLLSSLCSTAILAADYSPDNYLTGDWLGWRTKLHQAGVDVNLGYTFETGGNLSGGDNHAYSYADQTSLGFDFDLNRLIGLNGGSFHFALANRGGQDQDINDKAGMNDLMQSLEIYGRGRVTRITKFYYEQQLLSNNLDIKLGRMSFGDEFGTTECEFTYLGFCGSQPGNFNSSIYNWPISQWAGDVKYNFLPQWYAKLGLYQQNPGWLANGQGWDFGNPKGSDGVTIPVEFGWMPHLFGLPGTYKLGYWYDTAGGDDVYLNSDGLALSTNGGTPKQHSHKAGYYFSANQQVLSFGNNSQRGMNVFLYSTVNDHDIATVDRSVAAGVTLKGPFAIRPKDKWGIGIDYLHVSDRYADNQRAASNPVPSDEVVFASYYKFQLTNYFALRPEIQYLNHPGGTSYNANAWVATLKGNINF